MYEIRLLPEVSKYEIEALVKLFLPKEEFQIVTDEALDRNQSFLVVFEGVTISCPAANFFYPGESQDSPKMLKNLIKRGIYAALSGKTGYKPPWGILTGVKPVKIVRELSEEGRTETEIRAFLRDYYYLSNDKNELLMQTFQNQKDLSPCPDSLGVGIYIGIPFCPTRCVYCSFPANVAREGEIDRYLEALYEEIRFCTSEMKARGMYAESVYMGGGTPTTLDETQLGKLLEHIFSQFDLKRCKEFTLEAGRPDTLTKGKLELINSFGIKRISINPQSMNARTLNAIGRAHSPRQITDAYDLARQSGMEVINMDLIAGLPGESAADFLRTVDLISALEPENITIHTLALKRASRLKEEDDHYNYKEADRLSEMVDKSREKMRLVGYEPYYLYRQKYMVGNFENIGYTKKGFACIYNIKTMDEQQTMLALGAGGISKMCFPRENRIERRANVSNFEIYIQRLEEMKERKAKLIFANYTKKNI